MKFSQVPMGQRFAFEGEVYVRTRPLTATHEASGQNRLIRRSAEVEVLDETTPAASPVGNDALESAAVRAAFDTFYARCVACLDEPGEGPSTQARERLEKGRSEFLAALGLRE